MADQNKPGMISGMQPLSVITGEELMELSSFKDGVWKTYSVLVNKIRTNQGLSAYEVAVKNGFEGTEQEWLESLNGKSAYAIAVELGFTGTESEWLATLVGPSAYDAAVAGGFNGTEAEWLESLKGKSAYQIAVANGYTGTETEWLATLVGKSAYQIAKEIDPTIGTEAEWLKTLVGASAYEVAKENGFTGTEAEWLATLVGKSAYEIWLELGNVGSKAEFIESLKGEAGDDGAPGKSAFELWQALPGNEGKTEDEFFESLQADITREKLQALLDLGYFTTEGKFLVTGANGGLVSNAGFHNFLFLFDKRLNNADNSDPDKVPQYLGEYGRLEAEGFSYWKNAPAPTDDPDGPKPEIPDAEVRLYDDGRFEIGSATDFISFGNGSKVTISGPSGIKIIDLADATQGADGKSAYQIAVDNGFVGSEAAWLLSLKGANGDDGAPGKSAYQSWLDEGNTGTEEDFIASLKGTPGTNGTNGDNGEDGLSAYQVWEAQPGNEGKSEAQFFESLEGKSAYETWLTIPGNEGKTEIQFIASLKGETGDNGKSAYVIWLDAGNAGTEAQFLASLKGTNGTNGTNGTDGTDGKSINVISTLTQAEFDEIVAEGNAEVTDAYFVGEFMYVFNGVDWVKSNSLQGPEGRGLNYLGSWPDATPLPMGDNYVAGDTYIWRNSLWTLSEKPTRTWIDIGVPGPAGKSAYQIWLDAGNSGTQADFLASLKGDKGDDGDIGPDGKSAYQVWLDAGNEGTQQEFLASLKGPTGDPAAAFEIVDQLTSVDQLPTPGDPAKAYYVLKDLYVWFNSKDAYENLGSLDGASAYQIWLANGNTGTEAQFLASLKGTNGTNGKSAYQIAVDEGFVGDEATWLASLKGTNGTNGTDGTDGKNLQVEGTKADEAAIKAIVDPADQEAWVADDTGHLWIYNGTEWIDAGPFRGANGLSAYEIWLTIPGNAGKTEDEYLASLKGAPGTDGTNGTNGTNGRNVTIKGAVDDMAALTALPTPAQQDCYAVRDVNKLYMYIGTTWTDLGTFKGNKGDAGEEGQRGIGIVIVQEVELLSERPDPSTLKPGDAVFVEEDHKLYQVNDANVYGPGIQIQGPEGKEGPEGKQGPVGPGISIMGSYATEADLIAAHPTGNAGEGYLVGPDLYLYGVDPVTSTTKWYNAGPFRGLKGDQGPEGKRGLTGPRGPDGLRGSLWLRIGSAAQPGPDFGRPGDWAVNDDFVAFYRDEVNGWTSVGTIAGGGDVFSPTTPGNKVRNGLNWVDLPVDAVPNPVAGKQYAMIGQAGGTAIWGEITIPQAGIPEVPANTVNPQGRTSAGWVTVMAVPTGQIAGRRYEWLDGAWIVSAVQATAPANNSGPWCYQTNASGVGSWVKPSLDVYSLKSNSNATGTNFTVDLAVQQAFAVQGNGGAPVTASLPLGPDGRTTLVAFTVYGNTRKMVFSTVTNPPPAKAYAIAYNNNVAAADIEYGANQTVLTAYWNGIDTWIISKGPSF